MHNVCMATTTKRAPATPQIMKRWNVFMPPEMLQALESEATRRNTTSAELVRRAVRGELRRAGFRIS